MKIDVKDPPRSFVVKGAGLEDVLYDCAHIELKPNEQVTFKTPEGTEYDVTRKSWGYYATPSTNGRLKSFGLRAALIKASTGRYFVMLVESGKVAEFQRYLDDDKQLLLCWLDDDTHLARLSESFGHD